MSQLIAKTNKPVARGFNSTERRKRVIPLSYQMFGLGLNIASRLRMNWAAEILKGFFFTVFKTPMKPWIAEFWQQADSQVDIQIKNQIIPVRLWGEGPLVVMMHGWSGSGAQFRKLIPGLVAAGYRVAAFDAPAHGDNPGKQTHLLEFVDTLLGIQQQIGPVHTLMAHSFGGMASMLASHRGLKVEQMVLFAPHLDVNEIHQSYSDLLNLNPELSMRFHEKIGARMSEIIGSDDIWDFFTPQSLLKDREFSGLLIFDTEDEEIPLSQFKAVARYWEDSEVIETEGLGHHLILKDSIVIEKVLKFMTQPA
jgi:pimeloyl-ACP methyl ester carboxylesterase